MSKLEEIEKTVGKCCCEICLVKDGQVQYLLSLVKQTETECERLSKLLIEERVKVVCYRDMKRAINDTLYERNEFFTDTGKIILKLLKEQP